MAVCAHCWPRCAEAGFDGPFDAAAAGGAELMLFPAAPGLYGRRTGEDSWREGFAWWEGSALGDAQRHARLLGLWIALAGQAGATADEDFPGLAALVGPDGSVAARLPDWRPGVLTVDIPCWPALAVSGVVSVPWPWQDGRSSCSPRASSRTWNCCIRCTGCARRMSR